MDAYWELKDWPKCQFHVFLSHVREDTEWLVKPLDNELQRRQIIAWGDWKYDFSTSPSDPFAFFREKLLLSRHVVYLMTENAFAQSRGWLAVERAYAALLQEQLTVKNFEVARIEKVILAVSNSDHRVLQSAWYPLVSEPGTTSCSAITGPELIQLCADEIEAFVKKQAAEGIERLDAVEQDPFLKYQLKLTTDLANRIVGADPASLE